MAKNIDILDMCSKDAFDVFRILDKSKHPHEYSAALNKYTLLLLSCCCFYLEDEGHAAVADHITAETQRFYKNEMPFSFTTWAHKVYHNLKTFAEKQYDDCDDHDELRASYGQEIGKYLFEEYTADSQYDLLTEKLFEAIDDILSYLSYYYSFEEDEDSDENLFDTLTEEEQETRESVNPELLVNECIERLKIIVDNDTCINEFAKYNIVMISESPKGGLYGLEKQDRDNITRIEDLCHGKVYLIMRSFTNLGTMDSFFYVDSDRSEWDEQKNNLGQGYADCWVINHDMDEHAEYGRIAFKMGTAGAPVRVFNRSGVLL